MIVFTLCSNNYLAKASILAQSLREHNPDVHFIIGLVDKRDDRIDYSVIDACEILTVEEVGIPDFDSMVLRYDLIDLNTAVKPFYFQFLFERYASEKCLKICYLDPDVAVYASLGLIEEALDRAFVILTPHVLSPIPSDGKWPRENAFLTFGLYNLGFLGLRRSSVTERLLDWWSDHLVEDCRYDAANGLFVDQAWMDLVPIFFDGVEISRNPGFNVAYWNLHERQLELREGVWSVNGQWPLVFFHFSNLARNGSGAITNENTRFTLEDRPEMRPLFLEYYSKLTTHDRACYKNIPCVYVVRRTKILKRRRREYYRRHPFRWLLGMLKRSMPKRLKALVRTC